MSAYFCGRFVLSAFMSKAVMLSVSFSIFAFFFLKRERKRERERVDEEEDVDYEGALYINYVHEKRIWLM